MTEAELAEFSAEIEEREPSLVGRDLVTQCAGADLSHNNCDSAVAGLKFQCNPGAVDPAGGQRPQY